MQMFEGQCATKVLQSAISVEVGDGDPYKSKDARVNDVLKIPEVPENGHMNRSFSPQKGSRVISPTKVHLHQCTQHGQQTGGTGNYCTSGKL